MLFLVKLILLEMVDPLRNSNQKDSEYIEEIIAGNDQKN